MNKMKKAFLESMVCLTLATIMILMFSTRTSPLYTLLYGDYSTNYAASAMVIGKYWLSGSVPYVDLFNTGGPLYYLFNAVGWLIGERVGIGILEILSLALFFILTKKTLGFLVKESAAWILTIVTLLPFFSMFCGGNSDSQWALPFLAGALYIGVKGAKGSGFTIASFGAIGFICGSLIMLRFSYGGLAYAVFLYSVIYTFKHKDKRSCFVGCIAAICGASTIILPFMFYFFFVGGLDSMLCATFKYPFLALLQGFDSIKIIVHKLVKCTLSIPLIFIGIYYILRKEKEIGLLAVLISICTLPFMICGDGSWHYYLIMASYIPLAIALIIRAMNNIFRIVMIGISLIILMGVCVIPAIRYSTYILGGVPDVVEEFHNDLVDYYSQLDTRTLMMIDTDCSYYLINDIKPPYRYFTSQSKLSEYDSAIGNETYDYVDECATDVLITTTRSWVSQDIGSYMVVQVYCKTGGNISVYLPYSN